MDQNGTVEQFAHKAPPSLPEQPMPLGATAPESSFSKKKKFIIGGFFLLVVIIIGVGIVTFLNSLAQQNIKKATALAQSAQIDYNQGNYKSAEGKLVEALGLTHKIPNIYASLIYTIGQEGNISGQEAQSYNRSQSYITQALALYPKNENILLAVGYIDEIAGKYSDALTYYNKAIAIDPKNAEAWFHKGHDQEFLGQQSQAFGAYDKAYSLDPKNGLILLAKTREAVSKNDFTDAYNFAIEAAQSNTSDVATKAEGYTDAAQITSSNLLKTTDATTLVKKAISIYPNYSPALAEYGLLLYLNGNLIQGINYELQAIKQNSRISQNYYYIGIMLRAGKKYDVAINFFQKGLAAINNDNTLLSTQDKIAQEERLTYEIAITYYFANNSSQTLSYLQKVVGMDSSYRSQIKNDFTKYKYFSNLATNKNFLALIQ